MTSVISAALPGELPGEARVVTDNLDELLSILPPELAAAIGPNERPLLVEIVLDLGRRPEARFVEGYAYLRQEPVTRAELDRVEEQLGAFGDDNRAGLPATLHRISALRNRRGAVVGLTLRVGRAVTGIVDILRDLIESGQSVLLMGRPGLGKTTMLREMARVLADEASKRVVVVDTSNEIAGDGDVPHPAIGRARRMQVKHVALQHDVMIEAVENHMPEVVVIDEIGRHEETLAARTIAERGVQLIATVHGNTLENLISNPSMSDLIGGIQSVTLGDEEARRRRTQKTVLERKNPPTFDVVIEMIERGKIAVRAPVSEVVDAILRGHDAAPEVRWRDDEGNVQIMVPAPLDKNDDDDSHPPRDFGPGRGSGRSGRGGGRAPVRASSARSKVVSRSKGARPGNLSGGVYYAGQESGHPLARLEASDNSSVARASERTLAVEAPPWLHSGALSEDRTWDEENSINSFNHEASDEEIEAVQARRAPWQSGPINIQKIRRIYPFGLSRSRLARAAKHLGLPISPARSWQEADAVLMLSGEDGLPATTSMLREARELRLPIIGVEGGTYGEIVARLNDLYNAPGADGTLSPREIAVQEAKQAAARVLAEAAPFELRPQIKTLRRVQHQVAERYHLRSFSVGRDPNRRVKFVPAPGR